MSPSVLLALKTIVTIAVQAVEQESGWSEMTSDEKKAKAIEIVNAFILSNGWKVDLKVIDAFIEAAILAGEQVPPTAR